jgi:hypothetical protein
LDTTEKYIWTTGARPGDQPQFQLVATRTSRVTGIVANSDGAPLAGTSLTLVTSMGSTGWMMSGGLYRGGWDVHAHQRFARTAA